MYFNVLNEPGISLQCNWAVSFYQDYTVALKVAWNINFAMKNCVFSLNVKVILKLIKI